MSDENKLQELENAAFKELDVVKLKEELSQDIEAKADARLQEKLRELAGGDDDDFGWSGVDSQGKKAPRGWDEAGKKITEKAVSEAESRILSKIEQKEKERKEAEKREAEVSKVEQRKVYQQWDKDWSDLVNEGKMPKISEEIAKKIRDGVVLTDEDKTDKGLKARMDLIQIAMSKGDNNLYKVYHRDYVNEKARRAPVMGEGMSPIDNEPTMSYEQMREISKNILR